MVREEMSFKDISYLELWRLFVLRSGTICAISVEGYWYHEEQFCEIILNLDLLLRRSSLKYFLYRALASLMFSGVEPFMQFCQRAFK